MASQTHDQQTGFFESGGERVRYRVRGDGPPLLMIHGIGAPLELWQPLEARLSGYRTITVDPPGAGHSSTPQGRFRMRQFAGVMDDLLTHLRVESANVMGLSLGGMMAQELAHRHPDRVEKLVLASTSVGLLGSPISTALLARPSRSSRSSAPETSLLRLQWELRGQYTPSVRGYLVQLRAAWTWSSRPWLRKLEMPVLAIAGSDDRIVPVAHSRRIAATVRDGRLEVIPGGGHLCVLKQPRTASRLIREFLDAS